MIYLLRQLITAHGLKHLLYSSKLALLQKHGVQKAAELLAGIIYKGLGLDGGSGLGNWQGDGTVVVTLGGGHYAPRANSLGLYEHVWIGHMLATYALPFERDEEGNISGMWNNSIRKAISATKKATLVVESFVAWIKKRSKAGKGKQLENYYLN